MFINFGIFATNEVLLEIWLDTINMRATTDKNDSIFNIAYSTAHLMLTFLSILTLEVVFNRAEWY